jgi:hypothetical protein
MIRPEELRIGNYIEAGNLYEREALQYKNYDPSKEVIFFQSRIVGEYLKDCSPIPLTPEWLERFGFRRESEFLYTIGHADYSYVATHRSTGGFKDGGYFFGIRYDDWDLDPNTVHGFAYAINGIQHVHQLQNLFFALTGEDLKLVERLGKD